MNLQRNERHNKICKSLRKYHRIFYSLLTFSRPQFDEKFPTAGIIFDKSSFKPIVFKFGTQFFDALTDSQLEFVYCHEMSHILFNHGFRGKVLNPKIANIAMDIAINEFLLKNFAFDKEHILAIDNIGTGTVCTYEKYEKYFPKDYKVAQNFEYYYNFLFDAAEKYSIELSEQDTLDDHSSILEEEARSVLKKALEQLNRPELESLKTLTKEHGDEINPLWKEVDEFLTQPNPRFEDMFKREIKSVVDKYEYNWFKESPILANFDSNFSVPTDTIREIDVKEKIKLYLFLDTSGSCDYIVDRFFKLADEIPQSIEKHLYGFTTDVYEIKNRKIHSGGTSFYQIEDFLLTLDKYPSQILIITDGYAESVSFKHPERVTVFLTANGSSESFHQKEIRIIPLDTMETKK